MRMLYQMKRTQLKQKSNDEIIADLEAQTIAQARTIAEQAQVIREHEAADVIAVEAIRSQAEEITRLRAVIETTERCIR